MASASSSYTAVKILAREHPDWLPIVRACYDEAAEAQEFAGAWISKRLGHWFPSLRLLVRYGILTKIETTRGGRRAYYHMPDREGVGEALQELGILATKQP